MAEEKAKQEYEKIAVVRVRGSIRRTKAVEDTLDMLKLHRKNYCVLLPASPSIMGMINKIANLVTWGEVNEESLKLLEAKKEGEKKFYRLQPPRKGFGRKGVKVPFTIGGGVGYRGEAINDLLKRMI